MDMSMSDMDMSDMNMSGSSTSMDMDMSSTGSLTSSLLSSITSTMANMATTTASSSSMDMDMSGMSMSSSMDMPMSSASASSTMDMPMSSTSASSTMDMGSMDMSGNSDGSMMMNSYLVSGWKNYPVVFKTLKGKSSGGAFGVFCVIFFSAFFLRALMFLSAYLEQRVFHNYSNAVILKQVDNCACDPESEPEKSNFPTTAVDNRPFWRKFLFPGLAEVGKDIIRLLIAFVAAMFGYAIMLAAMSFVILYFFAACLGIAFGEVFFNRLAIVLGVNRSGGLCGALH